MSTGRLALFFIYFRTKAYLFKEQIVVILHFYKNLRFLLIDLLFFFFYLPFNPYRICRKGGSDDEFYGETPLTTLSLLAKECDICQEDLFWELGSGRGRGAFWLSCFVGCSVIAIERVSLFVKIAQKIALLVPPKKPQFFCEDFLQTDFRKASAIYLYGTCLKESEIEQLIAKFSRLPTTTKIITISYPLTDYAPKNFCLKKSFSLSFPWGETTAFLQTPNSQATFDG